MSRKLRKLIDRLQTTGYSQWNSGSEDATRTSEDSGSFKGFYPQDLSTSSIAPFVPSPLEVVRKMLELAEVKPRDTLFDLGCGDGRIVIMAANEFGSRAVGVDLNRQLITEAREKAERLGLEAARFIHGNMFDVDLRSADIVTMYLLTLANEKVRPKLESELKVGARVVTHDFPLSKWKCQSRVNFEGESGKHVLYLYVWSGDENQDHHQAN